VISIDLSHYFNQGSGLSTTNACDDGEKTLDPRGRFRLRAGHNFSNMTIDVGVDDIVLQGYIRTVDDQEIFGFSSLEYWHFVTKNSFEERLAALVRIVHYD
jgi:hypothetical protein